MKNLYNLIFSGRGSYNPRIELRSLAKGLTTTVVYKNYRSTRQKAHKRCYIRFSNHCVKNVPIRNTSPYLVWMRENTDQKNSKYGRFSRSEYCQYLQCCWVSQSQQYTITITSQNSRYSFIWNESNCITFSCTEFGKTEKSFLST